MGLWIWITFFVKYALYILGVKTLLLFLIVKEELHTRRLKNLKEREKYSLQNSAKMMKIG